MQANIGYMYKCIYIRYTCTCIDNLIFSNHACKNTEKIIEKIIKNIAYIAHNRWLKFYNIIYTWNKNFINMCLDR